MLKLRRSEERGHFDHGWLDTYHTFSFGDYHDAGHMGFRNLRVINEDVVQPARGFGTHGHRDMEIVTFVLEGELAHQDDMGNGSIIRPGDVQRMSAGRGVLHSEKNPSSTDPVHLLQVWILPDQGGGNPEYEQKTFALDARRDRLALLVSPDGRDGSVTVHANAFVFASELSPATTLTHELDPGRHAWLHVTRGELQIAGEKLGPGDGAAVSNEQRMELRAGAQGAAFLLFDLR